MSGVDAPVAQAPLSWSARRLKVLRDVLPFCGLVVLPVLLEAMMLARAGDSFAVDFRQTFLPAAEKLVSGTSPYPEYGYPPLVVFALAPFAVLPAPSVLLVGLLACSLPVSLWLFGLRDWRCYGAALLWAPVFHGLQTANVTLALLLGFAVAWRYRENVKVVAVSGGLTIAAKIVCWPILVWLVATTRIRSALGALAAGLAVTFGLWATLGFSGLVDYPSSLERLSNQVSPGSYTFKALAVDLRLGEAIGAILMVGLSVAVLAACVVLGRRGDDRRSFAFAVLAATVTSPIVWLHSFALLLAPLALLRPRFSGVWLLPALLWFASGTGNGAPWQTALVLVVAGAVFAASVWPQREPGSRSLFGRTGSAAAGRSAGAFGPGQ